MSSSLPLFNSSLDNTSDVRSFCSIRPFNKGPYQRSLDSSSISSKSIQTVHMCFDQRPEVVLAQLKAKCWLKESHHQIYSQTLLSKKGKISIAQAKANLRFIEQDIIKKYSSSLTSVVKLSQIQLLRKEKISIARAKAKVWITQ